MDLRERALGIKNSSNEIEQSLDQLASILEENTAIMEEMDATVDEQARRMGILTEAIEVTNQVAATLERTKAQAPVQQRTNWSALQ